MREIKKKTKNRHEILDRGVCSELTGSSFDSESVNIVKGSNRAAWSHCHVSIIEME